MKSAKDIEQALRQTDLDIEINARTDRAILDRLLETPRNCRQKPWRVMMQDPVTRIAAAIAIVAIAALLVDHSIPRDPAHTAPDHKTETSMPAINAITLNTAYRRGGMDAVEEQYRKTATSSKSRPVRLSVETLLAELAEDGDR